MNQRGNVCRSSWETWIWNWDVIKNQGSAHFLSEVVASLHVFLIFLFSEQSSSDHPSACAEIIIATLKCLFPHSVWHDLIYPIIEEKNTFIAPISSSWERRRERERESDSFLLSLICTASSISCDMGLRLKWYLGLALRKTEMRVLYREIQWQGGNDQLQMCSNTHLCKFYSVQLESEVTKFYLLISSKWGFWSQAFRGSKYWITFCLCVLYCVHSVLRMQEAFKY